MITSSDIFIKRLWAYLQQRFPLLGHGLLIISYYSSNQFLAQVLHNPGQVHYSSRSIIGALILFCVFFHLRVFDEHKDYVEDCQHYPDRILQRGIITLTDLKILGGIALLIEFAFSLYLGMASFIAWLVVLFFSVLMLKELFIAKWLKKHFLLYATSHMIIMPLMSVMVFSFTTLLYPWQAPYLFIIYAFVGFFVGFNWEVSRKIRAPEQEIDGVDSYTKIFGTFGAANMVLILRVIDTSLVALVGYQLQLAWWFYGLLLALFCVCLTGFFQYRFHTNANTAKRMETYAGIYMIAFDIILAITISVHYGIRL